MAQPVEAMTAEDLNFFYRNNKHRKTLFDPVTVSSLVTPF
jgi:hypothetical protein